MFSTFLSECLRGAHQLGGILWDEIEVLRKALERRPETHAAREGVAARSALVDQLTRDFDVSVQGVVQSVSSQASQMQADGAHIKISVRRAPSWRSCRSSWVRTGARTTP